jgi:hypothetical protein
MKHIKPFMESVGKPVSYNYGQIMSIMKKQVIDEITPGEIDKISQAIAELGLEGRLHQYQLDGNFGLMTLKTNPKPNDPVNNLYFTAGSRKKTLWSKWLKDQKKLYTLNFFKTEDDWWLVAVENNDSPEFPLDDSWYVCDGINQVVDLIRGLKSE